MELARKRVTIRSLDRLANVFLTKELKDKRRNKVRNEEYPILSESQIKRRHQKEIPFSSLKSIEQEYCNYICYGVDE